MRNAVWRAGDTALIVAPSGRAKRWNQLPEFLVVTKPHVQPTRPSGRRSPREIAYHCFPCGLFLCMVTLSALSLVPLVRGALVSLVLLLCSGHLRPMSTLKAVDGQVMLTLASAIGFGASLKASGLAEVIVDLITSAVTQPLPALALLACSTVLITELVTNNAAAVIMFPIGVGVADRLGVSYIPFVMSLMAAASTSFASPVGYTTNLMVLGPGGYKMIDFLKTGLLLDVLITAANVLLCPVIWPF